MIDLHSHLLPGVDDGARTVAQAVDALRLMVRDGVTAVCVTPHLEASRALNGIPAAHDRAFAALAAAAPPEITLWRGVELMLDRPFPAGAVATVGLRLAGTSFMLVEFPRLAARPSIERAIEGVVTLGLRPLLAHPERYAACSDAAVARWREAGALMQVDAGTLLAPTARGDRARRLIELGQADVVAADNHGDDRSMRIARDFLERQDGRDQAALLCERNPAAILANRMPRLVEPLPIHPTMRSRLGRLRRLLASEDQ